ncbi:MAG: hypothetical protein K0S24_4932 [Sphingobacterium sp.]|jgi:hypothetical protein|nr:hypothetical protein [Sphingobacterium sp.]
MVSLSVDDQAFIDENKLKIPSEEELYTSIRKMANLSWKIGLEKKDIERWISNFKGNVFGDIEYERRLALLILSSFVYYNLEDVRHLSRQIIFKFIHHTVKRMCKEEPYLNQDLNDLTRKVIKQSIFCPLGNPSESGTNILYYVRQTNMLPKTNFTFDVQSAIENPEIKNIVFIDDVTLSGVQAKNYFEKYQLSTIKDKNFYFLTFMATQEAYDILESLNATMIPAIFLDSRSQCFSETTFIFGQNKSLRDHCCRLATFYGDIIYCPPLGFNDDGYAFGFFYNTPDNTLPIFWSDCNGWKPIFKRFDKINVLEHYEGVINNESCKFI